MDEETEECRDCGEPFDLYLCPFCGAEEAGEWKDLAEFVGVPEDRKDEDKPAPVLFPFFVLQPVYDAHQTLGVDANGRPTWAEMREFLDEHGVLDVEERRIWQALWSAITAGASYEKARAWEAKQDPQS